MLICAKPSQLRHSEFPVRCSFIRIFVTKRTEGELSTLLCALPDSAYIEDETISDDILALLSRLGSFFTATKFSQSAEVLINALFYDILYKLVSAIGGNADQSESSSLSRIAREAYEYINENYKSDCSLKTISEAINVSPNHLHTVFTESFGITPYEHTVNKRIDKAKKLIMQKNSSMLEIALELGFCSQSHFNRIFKAQTGETPSAFRRRIFENY
jgi:AraC-like DNA-binding protein